MSSSRSAERLEKKLQNALRECQKRPENKRCVDCKERLPQWVVTDFNTFVCTMCSGIHREFSHRVKSISLATFSKDEVEGVKAGGNEVNNKLYMARYRPGHDLPEPEGGRAEKHREFIRTKYVDRRWYATPEDLEKDAQREKEREAARAKRDSERVKRDSASGGRGAAPKRPERASGGSTGRVRRGSTDRGLRKVDPPNAGGAAAAAVKPPPAPKQQVDLLDFLSDGLAPASGLAPGSAPVQAPPPAQQWAAFGGGETAAGAIAPPPAPPATGGPPGFASWTAFGDAPAASQQPSQQQQPQQKTQQQVPGFAFQDGSAAQAQPASGSTFPAFSFSTNFPATASADLGQQQQQQQQHPMHQQPWSQQQDATAPAPAGLPQAGFPQAGSHAQQPQPPQNRTAFGAQGTPGGDLSGMSPNVAALRPPPSPNAALSQAKRQPQPQQGFVQSGGEFPMSGARMSVPGTPVQQPQQVGVSFSGPQAVPGGAAGGFLNDGNAGAGFVASFEGLSLSSPAAGGVMAQQGGQGFPPQDHQLSGSQQGTIFPQGAGQPQAPFNPGVFFGGGMTPQQTPPQQPQQQGFAAFGQQPQFQQHPVGQPQFRQQQQQPQPHFQRPPGSGQGMQQQQVPQYPSPYQQQAAAGMGMEPSVPVQPPPAADVDPFAELAEGGGNGEGAAGNGSAQEPRFRKGDEVLYVRGSDPPLDGVIQKVHMEEFPPYYTVLISVTGREKNTDAAHLQHKKEGKEGVTNGRGHQKGQQRTGPDAFASLGVGAWSSTSAGATAPAAARVHPHAGPQKPHVVPQQAGPHLATKSAQPTLAQGQGVMPSAGAGMVGGGGGGGNPFGGIESPGLTAPMAVATGVAEQAGGNPFDMF